MTGRLKNSIEAVVLGSRYLLVPLILALLFVIFVITYDFLVVLVYSSSATNLTEHTLQALELLDITMIANLIWLISAGSYYVFVDNGENGSHKRPRCLTHVSAGILKEKMAGSLIGVSSVHLLQQFLHIGETHSEVNWTSLSAMLAIHCVFIVGLLAFRCVNAAVYHNHKETHEETTHIDDLHTDGSVFIRKAPHAPQPSLSGQ